MTDPSDEEPVRLPVRVDDAAAAAAAATAAAAAAANAADAADADDDDDTASPKDDYSFPFDTVIITFPDAAAAQAADAGPLQSLRNSSTAAYQQHYSNVQWVATADPYNARVGSGGGTLAALIDHSFHPPQPHPSRGECRSSTTTTTTNTTTATTTATTTSDGTNEEVRHEHERGTGRTLILHAGGAASRCPTQMCLGKAWTSLPTLRQPPPTSGDHNSNCNNNNSNNTNNTTERVLQTPLQLWLHTCRQLFSKGVPSGTLVVIAADTLLQWWNHSSTTDNDDGSCGSGSGSCSNIDWTKALQQRVVMGLAVPATLDVATNHGVFVMMPHPTRDDDKDGNDRNNMDDSSISISIESCVAVWQKPSIADMQGLNDPPCCFQRRLHHHPNRRHSHTTAVASSTTDASTTTTTVAWIDTGVTVFAPAATRSLLHLARTTLVACTATGLTQLYQQQQKGNGMTTTTTSEGDPNNDVAVAMANFAAQRAVSIDLYTHILHALSLSSSDHATGTTIDDDETTNDAKASSKEAYLTRYSHELSMDVATAIWNEMSRHTLQILAVPNGTFWHLGTTRELQSFLVDATTAATTTTISAADAIVVAAAASAASTPLMSDDKSTATSNDRQYQCRDFGASLGLTRRHYAYTHLLDSSSNTGDDPSNPSRSCGGIDQSAVLYHCLVTVPPRPPPQPDRTEQRNVSFIGARSVLEHCHLEGISCLQIGSDCLVSGLRSSSSSKSGIVIPDHTMVQMVRLQNDHKRASSSASERDTTVVVVVLGMDDNVKQAQRLYGQSIDEFFRQTEMCRDELWDASDSGAPTLWTARLHPIVSLANNTDSFASVFSWLSRFAAHASGKLSDDSCGVSLDPSFLAWKSSQRLSLSEIRDRADAPLEFAYRDALLTRLVTHKREFDVELHTILMDRQRRSVEFQFMVDEYAAAVEASRSFAGDVLESFHTLDQVVFECWHQQGRQDISARACTLASGLLDELVCSVTSHNAVSTHLETKVVRTCISSILASLGRPDRDFDTSEINSHFSHLVSHRDQAVSVFDVATMEVISTAMGEISSALTGSHVLGARSMADSLRCQKPIHDKWVLATAPARIDLSGGWSDTPPICYEFGSLVTGIAVTLDGRKPLACRCRVVTGREGILLRTEARDGRTGALVTSIESEINTVQEIQDCRDPCADCALLKCVLVHLGLVPESRKDLGFQSMLNAFCQSETSVRIEIVATTTLPHGSGLGTSSILAGCILAAICKCVGAGSEASYDDDMVNSVLIVEQYLTTGGGFQDQVNGIIGGVKVVSARANEWPMRISCQKLPVAPEFQSQLNSSLVLVFTGTTRLAKNLLTQVVRRWSRQTPEILATVSALVNGAEECRSAILSQDLDAMGCCLSKYWTLKKTMAGRMSGVEPVIVRHAIEELESRRLIRGASLCGAGGGGFMVLLRSQGVSISDLQQALDVSRTEASSDVTFFTWHECELCNHGLNVSVLDEIHTGVDEFDMAWLNSAS